jgi:hypothetical protein
MNGLAKSSSLTPVAFSNDRWGALSNPFLILSDRIFRLTVFIFPLSLGRHQAALILSVTLYKNGLSLFIAAGLQECLTSKLAGGLENYF